MGLPSTWFSFNGREVARYGADGAVLVDLGTPSITAQTATRQCCESDYVRVEDIGNRQTVLEIIVDREFSSYPEKRRWLFCHLTAMPRGAGELKIIESGDVFSMPNAVCNIEVADNDGIGCRLKYTFTGGEIKQLFTTSK